MGIFGKSKKEREKEYMNKLDVKSCLKENFELIIDDVFTIIGVPLLLISPGLSGQQAIRRQTISASDSCCPIN